MAETDRLNHQLQLLTHDLERSTLKAMFESINAEDADCWSQKDKAMIRDNICSTLGSLKAMTNALKVLLASKMLA